MPFLSLTLIDDYGRTTKKLVEMSDQVDLATYTSVAAGYITELQAVTDLGVVRADLIIDAITAGFAVTAGANIDVGATFTGLISSGNGKKASLKLPGVKPGKVSADGTIDVAEADIEDWLELYGALGDFELSDGETVATWLRGTLDK
jgi:hypothetical protein